MLVALILLVMQTIRASHTEKSYDCDDWRDRSYTSRQWAAYIESAKRIAAEPWKG